MQAISSMFIAPEFQLKNRFLFYAVSLTLIGVFAGVAIESGKELSMLDNSADPLLYSAQHQGWSSQFANKYKVRVLHLLPFPGYKTER